MRAVEEEAAEDEEDRHSDVHASQEAREDLPTGGSGQEACVGQQDCDSREGSQSLKLEKVVGLAFGHGWGVRCCGGRPGHGAHPAPSIVSTWAEVMQTPVVFSVCTTTVMSAMVIP